MLCPVRNVENNMWDQPQRGLGSDGIITSLAKGKLREREGLYAKIFSWSLLKWGPQRND